ncbi:MAG TPA: carboxypeptidase-like regulatory domain-containing protein [Candidatus Limnocylindria bacterium]|nr:carboxypeptidase-like regulatory domain-containing protein [Candidatus Limnocylindria bacterium]
MKGSKLLGFSVLAAALGGLIGLLPDRLSSQQGALVKMDSDDIGGVVNGANGPEAGVWVIAETTNLPTKFAKIVVTDEQGRYLMPDLPKATYDLWVRGYGLIDSAKVRATPGKTLNLKAVTAPSDGAAAQYYPAIYWYSMLKIPDKKEFPGTGEKGNGMPESLKRQEQWLDVVKTNGCNTCHQLGNKATRTIPKELGEFKSSTDAWQRRIVSGQAMTAMLNAIGRLDAKRATELYGEWTDRVAAGALPKSKPSRPQGVERNVVVSVWDWSNAKAYLHDEISTDKRKPTVNADGPLYGSTELSTDLVPVLDPVRHRAYEIKHPVRDPDTPSAKTDPLTPSPYWGTEAIWDSQSNQHNPMMDEQGRVWFTARVRPPANPDFCKKGSDHPSAKVFPIASAGRHLSMYDPKSKKFTLISTCFSTHHLVFAEDADHTLWTSAGGPASGVVGWLNRKMFEATGDEQKSQGWTPIVLDTNGNGKRDEWVEPNQAIDPAKDKRMAAAFYGIAVSPVDGTVWGSTQGFPSAIVRLNPGPNPSETSLAEYFEVPLDTQGAYGIRGMDIDRSGVVWSSLASGHLASFDRRKCKGPLNGPSATGKHCAEGWTVHTLPGPNFESLNEPAGSAESSYYTWVDQFDTFGLGKDVPIATGNLNDSLIALVDNKMVNLRVPYPLGFYAKWMDGRIDNPKTGWKGKGLWATTGTRTPFHMEGGKGTRPKVVKFQLRPDPLAK